MRQTHALTVRLPETTYQTAKRLAKVEGVSVNVLVREAIADRARRSAARRLTSAYELLGRDASEAEVESLLTAQVEALLND
jgi:hypothetical protein